MNIKRNAIILSLLLLVLLLCSTCNINQGQPVTPVEGTLTVSFIDVGQADSILVSDGAHAVLVDAGNNEDGGLVAGYIKSQGLDALDYAIGTHPDEDHIGGLDTVLEKTKVGSLIMSAKEGTERSYRDVVKAAEAGQVDRVTARAGTAYEVGTFKMEILGPVKAYKDSNNNSVVVKITYGSTSFLLTGDMEKQAEADLLDWGTDLRCDVLKAAHHGSNTSSTYRFLRASNPKMVVISCGANNDYGHPHDEPMSRFRDVGATVYRTDTMGTVVMTSDGKTISVNVEGESSPVAHTLPEDNTRPDGNAGEASGYIGNKNTKVFHSPACPGLPAEHNRVAFQNREEAVEAGYRPCGQCQP